MSLGRNMRSRCRCSMSPAIHINSRSWLRSSSTHEPSDPPLRVISRPKPKGSDTLPGQRLRQATRVQRLPEGRPTFPVKVCDSSKKKGGLARAAPGLWEPQRSLDLAQHAPPGHRVATGTGTLTESRLVAGSRVRGPARRSPPLQARHCGCRHPVTRTRLGSPAAVQDRRDLSESLAK